MCVIHEGNANLNREGNSLKGDGVSLMGNGERASNKRYLVLKKMKTLCCLGDG